MDARWAKHPVFGERGEHISLYQLPMNGGEAKAFDLKVKPVVDQAKLPDALPPKDQEAKPGDPKSSDMPIIRRLTEIHADR